MVAVTTVGCGQALVPAFSPRWLSMKTRSFSAGSHHLVMDILGRSQFPLSPLHYPHHWDVDADSESWDSLGGREPLKSIQSDPLPWYGYLPLGYVSQTPALFFSDLFKFPRLFPLFVTINGGKIFLGL